MYNFRFVCETHTMGGSLCQPLRVDIFHSASLKVRLGFSRHDARITDFTDIGYVENMMLKFGQ